MLIKQIKINISKALNLNNVLLVICLLAVNSAAIYFFLALNNLGLALSLALTISQLIISKKLISQPPQTAELLSGADKNAGWLDRLAVLAWWLLLICLFYLLGRARTGQSLVSPWSVVWPGFFALFFAAAFVLAWLAGRNRVKKYLPFLIAGHFLLLFSVAVIVYQLGYGFDPAVHQATVKLISQKGLVEPKPLYYLGQYGLEVILNKITAWPVSWLDKLLLPLLAAIFLPWELRRAFHRLAGRNLAAFLAVLASSLPFSFLIVTTPQNLAYLFLLLAIGRSLTIESRFDLMLVFALSLTALSIQPIAGLPAIIFAGLIWLNSANIKPKTKTLLTAVAFLASAGLLPLLFWLLTKPVNWTAVLTNLPKLKLNFFWPQQFYPFLNPTYFWGQNFALAYVLAVLAGAYLAWTKKTISREKIKIYLGLSLALIVSFFLTASLPFSFLISYERLNYARRLLLIAAFFALPLALVVLAEFGRRWQKQNRFVRLSWLALLAGLVTANFYLSYPRQDPYFNSRSYSTSIYDLKAVRWIDSRAGGDYIVLANQQVSAAALAEFGFKKYYHAQTGQPNNPAGARPTNDSLIFYYPIPTGGRLYSYYLKMIYQSPDRQTIKSACALAGVKRGYFVVNKYWWAFDKVVAEAKLSADNWTKFGQGQVYVFEYKF